MSVALLITRPAIDRDEPPELLAGISRGEAGAFDELVRLFHARVTSLAHRLLGWNGDIEDVVQDVFVTALQKAGSFRGHSSLWTWLTVITLNRCRTHRRRQKVIRKVIDFLARRRTGESAAAADGPALADETAGEVRAAVAALRPMYREVIVLFYLEHKSIGEIGELLGASANAIEVRLHRARAKLRMSLKSLNLG
jgi:RNA polymerase sigma-70 factor (ECF subfamily)